MPHVQTVLQHSEEFRLQHPDEVGLVAKRVRLFSYLVYGYYIVANTSGLASYVSGWYTRKLPYAAWYPGLDVEANSDFVILYVYQVSGMLMLSAVNITMEMFPSYILLLLSVQMELVCGRLETLAHGFHNTMPYEQSTNLIVQKELVESLKDCIKTHQELCRLQYIWKINENK